MKKLLIILLIISTCIIFTACEGSSPDSIEARKFCNFKKVIRLEFVRDRNDRATAEEQTVQKSKALDLKNANVTLNKDAATDPQIKVMNGEIVDKNEYFDVSFDSDGGSEVATQSIRAGTITALGRLQYKAAILNFLRDGFDEFINET